ncbi:MAG: YlmH/Sll1252 family protein [Sporomusaceae bacterium]|nr:YlmH/Sll1252 family protein [Sporomusaceae bacterium]
MSDREKLLRYYRADGDGDIAAKLIDLAEAVAKNGKVKVSDFLDPHAMMIAETVSAHYPAVRLECFGGYDGAERVKAAFIQTDFRGKPVYQIAALKVKWDKRFDRLTHRDVLGAVLGCGIEREMTGDIVLMNEGAFVLVHQSLVPFLLSNLTSVGPVTVEIEEADLALIPPKEEKIKEIRTTAASLRLDVIAAAGFGTSRTKMSDDIAADKIKLNWQPVRKSDQAVKAGDVISMRGRGRLEVAEVLGTTKKGRLSILLRRYL